MDTVSGLTNRESAKNVSPTELGCFQPVNISHYDSVSNKELLVWIPEQLVTMEIKSKWIFEGTSKYRPILEFVELKSEFGCFV